MGRMKCKWRKLLKYKCGKTSLLKNLNRVISKKSKNIRETIVRQSETNQKNISEEINRIHGYIDVKTNDLTGKIEKIIGMVEASLKDRANETNKIKAMFDRMYDHTTVRRNGNKQCPTWDKFDGLSHTHHIAKLLVKDPSDISNCNCKGAIAFAILVLVFLATICYVPIYATRQPQDSMVSVSFDKMNIPTTLPLEGYNHVYAHKISVDSTYRFSKDTCNLTHKGDVSPLHDSVTVHREIRYTDTGWYILLYFLFIAVIILVLIVLVVKHIMPYWLKEKEYEQLRYNDYIRLAEEEVSYKNLQLRTEMAIYEKREKAQIDEWQRDNEHQRKLDIMEQEYMAESSNVLKELAKTKNTVTLKGSRGSEDCMVIEQSILSDDHCKELKDIIEKYLAQGEDCCAKIKNILTCLTENIDNLEKVKNVFCGDNAIIKQDMGKKIDELISQLKIQGSSGVQQVVNLGGERREEQ